MKETEKFPFLSLKLYSSSIRIIMELNRACYGDLDALLSSDFVLKRRFAYACIGGVFTHRFDIGFDDGL